MQYFVLYLNVLEDEVFENELTKLEEETEIQNILNIKNNLKNKKTSQNTNSSAENFVLDQIKKK